MIELQMIWVWAQARIAKIREEGDDAGFTTLEWMAIAGVVIVAAIIIAKVLMDKGKKAADGVNVQ